MFTAGVVAVLCLAGGLWGWRSGKALKREQDEFDRRWGSRRGGGGEDGRGGDGEDGRGGDASPPGS